MENNENEKQKRIWLLSGTILDVRTEDEYSRGHIDGAYLIPHNEIPQRINDIAMLKRPILVYCAHGVRSAWAVSYLAGKGIDPIFDCGSLQQAAYLLDLEIGS